MNEVIDNILTRATCRKFTTQQVSEENLMLVAKCAVHAPCACNFQKWHFTVLHNHDLMKKLADAIIKELNRDPGYNFYAPDALIMCSAPRDSRFGIEDCACAQENMFLAAHSLGLGTCWINQLKDICDKPGIRVVLNEIGLDKDNLVWGMCAIGYPAEKLVPKDKDESAVSYVK